MSIEEETMKAYKVTIAGEGGIYAAENAGKARYKAYLAANEVFLCCLTDFTVVREPRYDPICDQLTRGITEEYADILLEKNNDK